jgi:hypothetical protein
MTAEIQLAQTAFAPGQTIRGTVSWQAGRDVRGAEIRLYWQTQGKGTSDVETVAAETFELPQPSDERSFSFVAPAAPPSFSGKLVSLVWGLELIVEPGGSVQRELVIGPGGRERTLDHPAWLESPEPPAGSRFFRFSS